MQGVSRLDAGVALGFVLVAVAEAVTRDHDTPGLLVFEVTGALLLASLAVRRLHPLVPICVLTVGAVVGTTVHQVLWPATTNSGGVLILAMMVAAYSLGAYGTGRVVVLGVLLPGLVVTTADLTSRSGWDRINGMVFVTVFIGLLPTAVGRAVRVRRERLALLRDQHELIVRAQRAQQESAALAERLRMVERLQPTLVEGLRDLAGAAESGGDPAEIETTARDLLGRTREEVVALTAPVEPAPAPEVPAIDHLPAMRAAAQPWAALAAGAAAAGLYAESTSVLPLTAPEWLVLPAAVAAAAPIALVSRRPVAAATLVWVALAAYSRLVAPLAGSLSETAIAVSMAFTVAALSRRRHALLGLGVCWLGQVVGVGPGDALSDSAMLLVCWLGGLAVHEVCRLVEQAAANNELLARQEQATAEQAVVAERLRLARELHDAIGHSLTVVALQAGAARRLAGHDPRRAAEVMRTVASAAADGVTALVHDDERADIAGLVDRLRATGLLVEADLADEALLAPAQRVIVHRIVQEALTNALRHAPGSHVTISVGRREATVEVVVANSAPAGRGSGPGTNRGLAGIQERVLAGAGEVSWGLLDDGGFEVRALLPSAFASVSAP